MRGNKLGNSGLILLGKCLAASRFGNSNSLESLDVGYNEINDDGILEFSSYLSENQGLLILTLDGN